MTVLLDTHCWLWWLTEPQRMKEAALEILKNPDTTVCLSSASSWEIAIKYSLEKLVLPEPPEVFIPSRMERDGFVSLPIQHSHAIRTAALPYHHKDPFDRLLIAQAMVERIPIVTADPNFEPYDVELIAC